ncbi:hypothetical protein PFISCL1PPCAC_19195 [Pristionchus fissidentatus]|uniref:CCHC-type domain-containing protein n=1 Tax=Pristionchus fissidentatus TaxID=1538716 RepID=A0AAV5WBY7_9BILA|nr:hypothetical protein PFISCL1PPCAC_19195 [Pristionchus fissidentatus]
MDRGDKRREEVNSFWEEEQKLIQGTKCKSVDEILTKMSKLEESVRVHKEVIASVCRDEGVKSLPELLMKMEAERTARREEQERYGGQGGDMRSEQWEELREIMELDEEETPVGKWNELSENMQALSSQLEALNVSDRQKSDRLEAYEQDMARARMKILNLEREVEELTTKAENLEVEGIVERENLEVAQRDAKKWKRFKAILPKGEECDAGGETTFLHGTEIKIVIDEKSPLHWMHACPECNREGREAGSLWEECPPPPAYRHLPIKRVIELAVLIRVVKLDKMTPSRAHKILEDTKRDEKTKTLGDEKIEVEECRMAVKKTCVHSRRTIEAGGKFRFVMKDVSEHLKEAYRSSLGERVEETTGYGTVILQKGLKNAPQGKSDSVHWEWYAEVTVEWRALLEHLRNREKKVKIVMILWPRSESRGRRNELWAYIKQVTECTAWEVVVIREPSGMDTEHDYEEQLTEMAAEVTERGDIRVLLNECAFVTDGYPISSLHLSHPHLTRSDWERAAGVWRYSGRWIPPPRMVQQRRIEADWNTPNKKESSRELHMSIEKMREELRKKREERMKETVCHECHLKGHFARNCPNQKYDPEEPSFDREDTRIRRGRRNLEEGDEEEEKTPKRFKPS